MRFVKRIIRQKGKFCQIVFTTFHFDEWIIGRFVLKRVSSVARRDGNNAIMSAKLPTYEEAINLDPSQLPSQRCWFFTAYFDATTGFRGGFCMRV